MNRKFLEQAMRKRGVSYYALKVKLHFSPDTLSSWEDGKAAKPATARRLAAILQLTLEELVRGLGIRLLRNGEPLGKKESVELAARLGE